MLRSAVDALVLFALPFGLYAVALLLQRRFGLLGPQWTGGRLALLSLAGLGLVILGLLVWGAAAPRGTGAYVPAHLDNGRLVPGRIQ